MKLVTFLEWPHFCVRLELKAEEIYFRFLRGISLYVQHRYQVDALKAKQRLMFLELKVRFVNVG